MRVNVGDIVLVEFPKFNGEVENAMFLVIHHDCTIIRASTRFQAVKISTNPATFQIELKSSIHTFLRYDSYINCSIISSFIEEQVIQIIGRANQYIINNVLGQLNNYFNSVKSQLEETSLRLETYKLSRERAGDKDVK